MSEPCQDEEANGGLEMFLSSQYYSNFVVPVFGGKGFKFVFETHF